MTPDYPSYSQEELHQVKRTIDAVAYPERYQQLIDEIAKRETALAHTPAPSLKPMGVGAYAVGACGFFPFLGIPFAIIALIWGLSSKREGGKTLAFVGAAGIFTILMMSLTLYLQQQRIAHPADDDMTLQAIHQAQQSPITRQIDEVARLLELYHYRQGEYPLSLEQLKQAFPENHISVMDDSKPLKYTAAPFVYQRLDDGYQLLGVGPDGIANTQDDVIPQAAIAKGWRKR
ncbi:hypothetical protein HR45_12955 [Shewanella mangrovi]|uniref:Type II secretion system protein GspG C-terminal domain-containing protein n=1 Tax=Shewanella mangrovi TaxID=1515746 RepID=A0A094LP84_9GAMM|nr:hypothetical protein [Shewanella mangrovi]KFZ36953.1 hypothetical protein HR45_12955 [Shewanella mangrovi]